MEKYFNTKELGEYLRIPEQTIRRWVMNNEIPFCRIHNVIRYRLSDIETWVSEHKEKVPAFLNSKQSTELFNETGNGETVQSCQTTENEDRA